MFIDIVDKWVRDVQAVVHGIIDCASKEGMSIPDSRCGGKWCWDFPGLGWIWSREGLGLDLGFGALT